MPDPGGPLDATSTPRSADAFLKTEAVSFASGDQRVPALLALPVLATAPHACVVLVHGLGGRKEETEPFWGAFALAGMGVIAIDARLHGERTPADFLDAVSTPEAFAAVLRDTASDVRRTLDYLETRPECDPGRLGYLGASMGALIGSLAAGSDDRIQAPVLLAGGGDWRIILEQSDNPVIERIRQRPGGLDAALVALDAVDPVRFAPTIAPRALLQLNGDADPTIPPAAAQALFDAAGEPKRIEWWSGGHGPEGFEALRIVGLATDWFATQL